ncbi:MAG: sigma-54 dependent transcriptional regulator [Polyangiaceae bacterium]
MESVAPVANNSRPSLTLRPTSRGKIVGQSSHLCDLVDHIDRVARANCNVLVTGESGTGKELLVAALHDASLRAKAPLVTINCGAIPEALLESELFGHVKGAFTGAHANRQGRVAAAEHGTLFLDEIGEMPLALQVKLLRLLQQREYSPVGDSRTVKCDVRIVAATNRDLAAEVAAGRFREDLYYRLNVIHLRIPPLRERPEDIPSLAQHFFRQFRDDLGRPELEGITPEALELLQEHAWPGNTRELENVIERGVLLAVGKWIDVRDIASYVHPKAKSDAESWPSDLPETGIDLRATVIEFETQMIRKALARTGGNKNRAAQLLGLNRTTLVEMVKRRQLG